jgi:hypothetical protein
MFNSSTDRWTRAWLPHFQLKGLSLGLLDPSMNERLFHLLECEMHFRSSAQSAEPKTTNNNKASFKRRSKGTMNRLLSFPPPLLPMMTVWLATQLAIPFPFVKSVGSKIS